MFRAAAWLVCAAGLVACGGGGDAPAASAGPSDKYIGSWGTCLFTGPGTISASAVFTFTRIDATRANYTLTATGFGNPDCTGPVPGAMVTQSGTVSIDGTGIADGKPIEKITTTAAGVSDKDIVYLNGNQLQFGNGTPVDADGYPTTLDTSVVFTRQ